MDLAAEFGTPLFVYDEAQLRARCREAVAGLRARGEPRHQGLLVPGHGPVGHRGRHAPRRPHRRGVPRGPGRRYPAGPPGAARQQQVDRGAAHRVGRGCRSLSWSIPFDELDRIETLVGGGLAPPKVLMRITPGVEAHTHEFVRTGQDDSKFGFGVASEGSSQALARAAGSDAVELVGMHADLGQPGVRGPVLRDGGRCPGAVLRGAPAGRAVHRRGPGRGLRRGRAGTVDHRVGRCRPPGLRPGGHHRPGHRRAGPGPSWPRRR